MAEQVVRSKALSSRNQVRVLRGWIERILAAQENDANWKGLGSWTRQALRDALAETAPKGKADG